MKPGGGKNKGSDFERLICKTLSKWWTEGARDDLFIRSVTSGGWNTNRRKSNQDTYGQSGDIALNDPLGQPLLDAFCFELKCGYGSWNLLEVIEGHYKESVLKPIESFIVQAEENHASSNALSPALILKRDRKHPVIAITKRMFVNLQKWIIKETPQTISLSLNRSNHVYIIMSLDVFLTWCTPKAVERVLKR